MVGADRIAANGDTANKIGTYQLVSTTAHAVLPRYYGLKLMTNFSIESWEQYMDP